MPEWGAVRLPGRADSVSKGRRFVADTLAAVGVDSTHIDSLELIVSELLTNAVLHAHGEVSVQLAGSQTLLRLEVTDAAAQLPVQRGTDREAATGRGLEIVAVLATDFGVIPHAAGGKTVWVTVDLAPEGEPAPAEPQWPVSHAEAAVGTEITVILDNFPWQLYDVIRERNEGLLRDFALHRLEHLGSAGPSPDQISLAEYARQPLRDAVEDAMRTRRRDLSTPPTIDIELRIDRAWVPAFDALRTLLEAADELTEQALLLTAPTLPELRAVQDWYFDQIAGQSSGRPPTPWQPIDPAEDPGAVPKAPLHLPNLLAEERAIILADNNNRVVAATRAIKDLLGWRPADLIGRRLTVLIPPDLREQHVIGFTRFLSTGRSAILGQRLSLDAWSRDGRRVPVQLVVEQRHAAGVAYYAAEFEARNS